MYAYILYSYVYVYDAIGFYAILAFHKYIVCMDGGIIALSKHNYSLRPGQVDSLFIVKDI